MNDATNFEQARGFVRTNWKTARWNPNDDPTQFDSSTDSEDEAERNKDENRDTVSGIGSPLKNIQRSNLDSEERDGFGGNRVVTRNDSLSVTHQMSDSKARKRLYTIKPVIVDINSNQSEMATMPSV